MKKHLSNMCQPGNISKICFGLLIMAVLSLYLVDYRFDGSVIYNALKLTREKSGLRGDMFGASYNTLGRIKPIANITLGINNQPTTTVKVTDRSQHISLQDKIKYALLPKNKVTRIFSANGNWTRVSEVPGGFVRSADCAALFRNSTVEQARFLDTPYKSNAYYNLSQAGNCQLFRNDRQYIMSVGSPEEAEFPLAFSIVMYHEPEMVERLLRAIYRPNNVYCIHVDSKANGTVYGQLEAVAACFPNVLMAQRVNVTWGTMSVVESELQCMRRLWPYDWRYLINLTGEEFPLKTNRQIVKILKSFNGTNGVHGSVKWSNPERWGNLKKRPPPHNITLTKGSVHFAVTRGYVEFLLHDPISYDFQQWVADTWIPDETFFSSLNHNPHLGVPGSHKKLDEEGKHCPYLVRHKSWLTRGNPKKPSRHCYGIKAHNLCIFGVKDLPNLKNKPQLFVNKFHADYAPLAYDCMEELHYNRTRDEIVHTSHLTDQQTFKQSLYDYVSSTERQKQHKMVV